MRALALLLLFLVGCNDDDLYETCDDAGDCEVPDGEAAACFDKAGEGYCSWECTADADCEVEDDELENDDDDVDRVCASFENEEGMFCFPPCEESEDSCPDGLTCRSTGGGDENRKVCFPDESDTNDDELED